MLVIAMFAHWNYFIWHVSVSTGLAQGFKLHGEEKYIVVLEWKIVGGRFNIDIECISRDNGLKCAQANLYTSTKALIV